MPFELPSDTPGSRTSNPAQALLIQADIWPELPDLQSRANEFAELARAAGICSEEPVHRLRIRNPSAATLIGSGRLEQLAEQVRERKLPLAIFNNQLKPGQERNLEKALGCRVLDRTGLILDIFSRRAHSHAGRLQVELAQLQHLSARLQRGWSHLERQKGGIGLRGPGESQLETDRRLVGKRIHKLKADLTKLRRQRQLGYRRRQRNRTPLVALVGYTNAGKSTLLNSLLDETMSAADRLFETLDTSSRRWPIGLSEPVILADTVGFISDLPHSIIEAFHATLEGITQADLLLIVEDQSDPRQIDHRREVQRVLAEIGAEQLPTLTVLNKTDRVPGKPDDNSDSIDSADNSDSTDNGENSRALAVSALRKTGLEELRQAVANALVGTIRSRCLRLSPEQGALRSQLYRRGIVQSERTTPDGTLEIQVQLADTEYDALCQSLPQLSAAAS